MPKPEPPNYRIGNRRPDLRLYPNKQFSENRFAWVNTERGKFIIIVGNESGELGNDVVLYHPRAGKVPDVTINLTSMTEEELDAFEDIIKSAIEWARPICKLRDQEAQDAFDKGDDSFARIYRPVPQLVYRKRPEPEHYQGVQLRPQGVSEGSRGRESAGTDSDDRGVRRAGDELAEPDEVAGDAQDDGSAAD